MSLLWRRGRASLLAALLLAGLANFASLSEMGYRFEALLLDVWFGGRYQLKGAEPLDPRLVMIGLDSRTLERFGKPTLFWQADLAELVERVSKDGPAAIGLDVLVAPKLQGLSDDDPVVVRLQDEALTLGLVAYETSSLILVELHAEDEADPTSAREIVGPHQVITALLSDGQDSPPQLGFANIATDPDGSVRRLKLIPESRDQKSYEAANFAFRLLHTATGEPVALQGDRERGWRLSWRGREAPLLFGDSLLIDYPGPTEDPVAPDAPPRPTESFPIYSAAAVLDGALQAGLFKDKIVVIAPTAASLDDLQIVPGDPAYYGGAIHLSVVNMFLQDRFIYRSKTIWLLFLVGLSLAGVLSGRRGHRLHWPLGCTAIAGLGFLAFIAFGHWLPTLSGLVVYSGGLLAGYLERLVTIERDRARVRATFGRMVSPQVMEHVLKNPRDLQHGVRKEVTVLFVDINDFTPTCERHEPEEIITMLSRYFTLMVGVILEYDGYIKQYVGDEIMVIYGAPDDGQDHATRAVLTALKMRKVLAKAKREAGDTPGFYDVKIGINSGPVVVGKVGPEQRWEYAAVGDSVNLGARVMSCAQKIGLDIGVSQRTYERYLHECTELGRTPGAEGIVWTSQGVHSFKGKQTELVVYSVSERDPKPPSDPPEPPGENGENR